MRRRRLFIIVLILLAGGYFGYSRLLAAKAAPVWRGVALGIELRSLTAAGPYGPAKIAAVRINPAQARIRVVRIEQGDPPGARSEEVCPARGAAINASFFAEKPFMQPLGLLICDGKKAQSRHPVGDWGTFLVTDKGAKIIASSDILPPGVKQAVETKPRLVIEGTVPDFRPQPAARRSAVGVDGKGRVILAASDGFLTLEQWAGVLRESLDCPNALNLDGGPSTQFCVRGEASETVKGGWPVPVVITAEAK
jgi:uncharacterized protein YigE (DUF2233 family)